MRSNEAQEPGGGGLPAAPASTPYYTLGRHAHNNPPACLLDARAAHARRGKCRVRRSIVDIIMYAQGQALGVAAGPKHAENPWSGPVRAGRGGSWPAHVPPAQQRSLPCRRSAPRALGPPGLLKSTAGSAANTILGKPSAAPMCRSTSRERARIGRPSINHC